MQDLPEWHKASRHAAWAAWKSGSGPLSASFTIPSRDAVPEQRAHRLPTPRPSIWLKLRSVRHRCNVWNPGWRNLSGNTKPSTAVALTVFVFWCSPKTLPLPTEPQFRTCLLPPPAIRPADTLPSKAALEKPRRTACSPDSLFTVSVQEAGRRKACSELTPPSQSYLQNTLYHFIRETPQLPLKLAVTS